MRIIILDRDGVINQDSDDYIKSVDEWQPIEGSIEAISKLSQAGIKVVIATNQSGLARGLFDEIELAKMHQKMCELVELAGGTVDGVFYCPHLPADNCQCRKPKPGLIASIEKEFNCSAKNAYFIGDSLKDIQAARAAGCTPILVKTGKGLITLEKSPAEELANVQVFDNLLGAVNALIN